MQETAYKCLQATLRTMPDLELIKLANRMDINIQGLSRNKTESLISSIWGAI